MNTPDRQDGSSASQRAAGGEKEKSQFQRRVEQITQDVLAALARSAVPVLHNLNQEDLAKPFIAAHLEREMSGTNGAATNFLDVLVDPDEQFRHYKNQVAGQSKMSFSRSLVINEPEAALRYFQAEIHRVSRIIPKYDGLQQDQTFSLWENERPTKTTENLRTGVHEQWSIPLSRTLDLIMELEREKDKRAKYKGTNYKVHLRFSLRVRDVGNVFQDRLDHEKQERAAQQLQQMEATLGATLSPAGLPLHLRAKMNVTTGTFIVDEGVPKTSKEVTHFVRVMEGLGYVGEGTPEGNTLTFKRVIDESDSEQQRADSETSTVTVSLRRGVYEIENTLSGEVTGKLFQEIREQKLTDPESRQKVDSFILSKLVAANSQRPYTLGTLGEKGISLSCARDLSLFSNHQIEGNLGVELLVRRLNELLPPDTIEVLGVQNGVWNQADRFLPLTAQLNGVDVDIVLLAKAKFQHAKLSGYELSGWGYPQQT